MLKTGTAGGAAILDLGAPKGAANAVGDRQGFAEALDGQMRRMERPDQGESASTRQPEADKAPEHRGATDDRSASRDGDGEAKTRADHEAKGAESPVATDDAPTPAEVGGGVAGELLGEAGEEEPLPGDGKRLPPDVGNALPADSDESEREARSVDMLAALADNGRESQAGANAAGRAAEALGRQAQAEGRGLERAAEQGRGLPRAMDTMLVQTDAEGEVEADVEHLLRPLKGERSGEHFFQLLTAGRKALAGRTAAEGVPIEPGPGRAAAAEGLVRALGAEGASGLAPATAGTGAPPSGAASAVSTTSISVPVQQQGWDQALGEKVVWMTRQNVQEAQVQLNPRHLGPIEMRVSVNNDQVNVQFNVQNPVTREAVEAAMPRLREMLGDSGLNLAQSDVSDQRQPGQGPDTGANQEGEPGHGEPRLAADDASDVPSEIVTGESAVGDIGAVDYFA